MILFSRPRLTLSRKIFAALATLLLVLLLAFSGLSILGLQQGLAGFVAEIEIDRLGWLAQRLEKYYADQGSWRDLEGKPGAWIRLTQIEPAERLAQDRIGNSSVPPGWPPLPRIGEPGPPPGPMPPPFAPFPPDARPPMPVMPGMHSRLALLDADDALVAGARVAPDAVVRLPLRAGDRVVGYLALAPLEALESEADRAFLRRQAGLIGLIGLAGLALALLLSWWLARRWFAPIDELAQAAQAVARGRLQTRVAARGSDELAFLGRTFNYLAERLDSVESSRRAWLADIAHELRTPLAAMRAEIEALQDGIRSFDQKTALRLHRQVMRLSELVDDLRSSMRADERPMERAPVYPMNLLQETLSSMRERFAQRELALDARGIDAAANRKPMLEGDGRRLHQAFANLLENSLRYTNPGGRLQLRAWVEGSSGAERLIVTFDDTEPAPTAAELPQLFDRLFRGDASRSRESGGSGLGLAICREAIEAHGGYIEAAPSELGGLRIVVTLPLDRAPQEQGA